MSKIKAKNTLYNDPRYDVVVDSRMLEQHLKEKDQQIAEIQKQLEEKEKDNQFFKKMYLSEKQKNDNYHTEKYALDKPVEELRKIKLTPKEKEIYYKGFDNCERQFATHIAELEQQLEEKEKEIRQLDNEKGMLLNNSMKLLKEKDDKLKSYPAEIVEKIKEFVDGNAYYYEEEQYAKHIIKYLDDILKEYQK